MPHVIVKLHAGRSEQQKARIADAVTKAVMATTGHGEDAASVAIEDVEPKNWAEQVYKPDIIGKSGELTRSPATASSSSDHETRHENKRLAPGIVAGRAGDPRRGGEGPPVPVLVLVLVLVLRDVCR